MATLLVIDDHPDTCDLLKRIFERRGHEVHCTTDPTEALGMVRRHAPDLVVMDLSMPKVDGLDVLASVRGDADAGVAATRVMLYSAITDPATIARAMELGAQDYVVKGTPVPKFLDRVNSLLG